MICKICGVNECEEGQSICLDCQSVMSNPDAMNQLK